MVDKKKKVTPVAELKKKWDEEKAALDKPEEITVVPDPEPEAEVVLTDEVSILKGQLILVQNQLAQAIDEKYAALAKLEKQPTLTKQQQYLVDLGIAGKNVNINVTDEKLIIGPAKVLPNPKG